MVLKSMQSFRYFHELEDVPGFFSKMVHQLSNQFICVIICFNCWLDKPGLWEQIGKEDMAEQLSKECFGTDCEHIRSLEKVSASKVCEKHSECTPNCFTGSDYFGTPHIVTQMVCVSHFLQCASVTLGHEK